MYLATTVFRKKLGMDLINFVLDGDKEGVRGCYDSSGIPNHKSHHRLLLPPPPTMSPWSISWLPEGRTLTFELCMSHPLPWWQNIFYTAPSALAISISWASSRPAPNLTLATCDAAAKLPLPVVCAYDDSFRWLAVAQELLGAG